MIIYLSLAVAIIGLVTYIVCVNNKKLEEIGRLSFACGLLAFLLQAVPHLVGILK